MLINQRTGDIVADYVELADTRAARRRGLLGRDGLSPSSAMVLSPCFAVHTAFMRFAIDVVFVDRDGRAVRIVSDLAPWRMAMAFGARAAIECPAGELRARDVRVGDRLYLAPAADAAGRVVCASASRFSLRSTASKPACSGS